MLELLIGGISWLVIIVILYHRWKAYQNGEPLTVKTLFRILWQFLKLAFLVIIIFYGISGMLLVFGSWVMP